MVVVWLTESCDSKVDGKAFSTAEKSTSMRATGSRRESFSPVKKNGYPFLVLYENC